MELFRPESDADREAIFAFRYSVYLKEMGRYGDVADHSRGRV